MVERSFFSRVIDALLQQEGECDREIRALSLATLNDDDSLSIAALFWTQIAWFWSLAVTGWFWLVGLVLADVSLFVLRWKIRRAQTSIDRHRGTPLDALFPLVNIGLIALVSIDVAVLTQAPSERTSILALILALGFCGYVVALFTAFPVLAMLNIFMLVGSLAFGLALGYSDVARPFALLMPGGAIAF